MSMDKLFIIGLAVCFFGFVIYLAWNSKQNEKRAQEIAEASPEPDRDDPAEGEAHRDTRRKKRPKEPANV